MFGKDQFTTVSALTLALLSALLLIAARPVQAQTETVLYNFTYGTDTCCYPRAKLTFDSAGNFYGATYYGGIYNAGTVFELSPNGDGSWSQTVLYSFTGGADGGNPWNPYVTFDSEGNLYGTTANGGTGGYGVAFKLSRNGESWRETVLYGFANNGGGVNPFNGLIIGLGGHFYGEAFASPGFPAAGVVFELRRSGGRWIEQVIYTSSTGLYAALSKDAAGNIFSTGSSTVFELSPNGNGGWNPTVIHTFTGAPKDGSIPLGRLVQDKAGKLFGTTVEGGAANLGTVYGLIRGNDGKWTEKILHSFEGAQDGNNPFEGIVFGRSGNLYGTTTGGGNSGDGTVFELARGGNGSINETILWSFDGTDGSAPGSSLILDSAGNLYGTTEGGGSSGYGVVFEVTP
jgi:uncharacterized repeat protein (TIGR03803 family)